MHIKNEEYQVIQHDETWARLMKAPAIMLLAGFALILLGVKFWLIHAVGDPTPFWDQWPAEGVLLYKPWLEGNLRPGELFNAHNEHRIFTTRLLALALLEVNGIWNPLLQMVVNAVIHVLSLVLCVYFINKSLGGDRLPMLAGFGLILFTIPYSTGNTLAGFQVSFYFSILFGVLAVWITTTKLPNQALWWVGLAAGVLAFLSLSPGLVALIAAGCTQGLIFLSGGYKQKLNLVAALILCATGLACALLTPGVTDGDQLGAQFLAKRFVAWAQVLAWPSPSGWWLGVALQLPALIFSVAFLSSRPRADDRKWFLLALFICYLGQAFAIAYGRPDKPTLSRYTDFYAIGLLVNFSCILALIPMAGRPALRALVAMWLFVLLLGFSWLASEMLPGEIIRKKRAGQNYSLFVSQYIQTGNIQALQPDRSPRGVIPYTDANALAQILDDETIRQILPSNVRAALTPDASSHIDGFSGRNMKNERGVTIRVLDSGGMTQPSSFSLKYPAQGKEQRWVRFYVRGLDAAGGSSIHVTQGGRELPLELTEKKYHYWGHVAQVVVGAGSFTIDAYDREAGRGLVVSLPVVVGRLDEGIDRMLAQYPAFLFTGAMLLLLCLFPVSEYEGS